VIFYHTDPVGTPLAMTDTSGNVVWQADYRPFGEEQSVTGSSANDRRFVGKEKDDETGLSYFDARYNDAKTGRFVSVDPVGAVDKYTGSTNYKLLLNPQRMNSYGYGLNNPYRNIDNDGRWSEDIHNAIIDKAFPGKNYASMRDAFKKASVDVDTDNQATKDSYMHGMSAPGQSTKDAEVLFNAFLKKQADLYKENISGNYRLAEYTANYQLGKAMHAIMDTTSPSHSGFQVWNGLRHPIDGYIHVRKETKTVFNGNSAYMNNAVRLMRDYYVY
jgi:RHS repeat-associated protein